MVSPRRLIVVGCGGMGREAVWLARGSSSPFNVVGFLDDADAHQGSRINGVPVVGRVSDWIRFHDTEFVVAVGSPRTRQRLVSKMYGGGAPRFASLVHESVIRPPEVPVGEGSIVSAGCVMMTNVSVGRHVIPNINSTLSHDTSIGDFCTIAPMVAVSGNVRLEPGTQVGTGACLRDGITLGRGSMAGMGSVVVRDVAARDLVVGNPARSIRQLEAF